MEQRILDELHDIYTRMNGEGALPSRDKLAQYYDTFRSRFGPEVLRGLDGEDLLVSMHNHGTKDSLVYWLEFKDDEEFPAIFGKIGGGSALKFGIYRRKETGAWMTGSPKAQKELTLPEAIEIARRHRDQLVRGCEAIERLDLAGGDAAYAALQKELDEVAPGVADTAWGIKYFSLLGPEKVVDFCNLDFQRFHLIKLLQIPPAGEGRYLSSGRYVALSRALGAPMNHLTAVLGRRHGRPHRYWRVGTSDGKTPRKFWGLMRDGNCVAVGWPQLGDMSGFEYNRESKEKLRRLMEKAYPSTPQQVGRQTQQLFNFLGAVNEGDLAIAMDGQIVLGIGKVTGPYEYDSASEFPHRRPVKWLSRDEWRLPVAEGLRTTVHELRKHVEDLIEIERHLIGQPKAPDAIEPPPRTAGRALDGIPGRVQAVLDRKSQVIIYGPPGTGKTHWAIEAAQKLAALHNFDKHFDELGDADKAAIVGAQGQQNGFVRMCCFHPAYGYDDFIEGFRPVTVDGKMTFECRDGVFKRLCGDAGRQGGKRFYLVIDEINRGDIPRIFGELLMALEKDKRGRSILLPLTGTPFSVPPNVFVIGTMNTADRSIALLDTALRRRFGFVELMPDSSLLKGAAPGGVPLGPWLDALNDRIVANIGRDARNLQVGHAYFLEKKQPIQDFGRFARILREDILPLIQEYCYEDYATLQKILGESLVDATGQRIREEVFDASAQEDLVRALMAPCPDLATTVAAVTLEAQAPDGDENADDDEADEESSQR